MHQPKIVEMILFPENIYPAYDFNGFNSCKILLPAQTIVHIRVQYKQKASHRYAAVDDSKNK